MTTTHSPPSLPHKLGIYVVIKPRLASSERIEFFDAVTRNFRLFFRQLLQES